MLAPPLTASLTRAPAYSWPAESHGDSCVLLKAPAYAEEFSHLKVFASRARSYDHLPSYHMKGEVIDLYGVAQVTLTKDE